MRSISHSLILRILSFNCRSPQWGVASVMTCLRLLLGMLSMSKLPGHHNQSALGEPWGTASAATAGQACNCHVCQSAPWRNEFELDHEGHPPVPYRPRGLIRFFPFHIPLGTVLDGFQYWKFVSSVFSELFFGVFRIEPCTFGHNINWTISGWSMESAVQLLPDPWACLEHDVFIFYFFLIYFWTCRTLSRLHCATSVNSA